MTSNRFASHHFLFGCPYYENNLDCPFTELRKLAIEERIHLLKKMTFQDANNLEHIHENCLKERKCLKVK